MNDHLQVTNTSTITETTKDNTIDPLPHPPSSPPPPQSTTTTTTTTNKNDKLLSMAPPPTRLLNNNNNKQVVKEIAPNTIQSDKKSQHTFATPSILTMTTTTTTATVITHQPPNNNNNNNVELIYKEPSWSKSPKEHSPSSDLFQLEEIKGGTIIDNIDINDKAFHLVGRLPICDIIMDNPSISRQHAVIQHRPEDNQLLLYDLNSTHGTFINKKKCNPNHYLAIKDGDFIKFGESSRIFVVINHSLLLKQKQQQQQKQKQQSSSKTESFVKYYNSSSSSSSSDNEEGNRQKILASRKSGWGSDDRFDAKEEEGDEEEGKGFNQSNSAVQYDKDNYDYDDSDDFYDRTNKKKSTNQQNKMPTNTAAAGNLKQLLYTQLVTKMESLKEEEEDSLDKFMNDNQQSMTKIVQQQLTSQIIDVDNQMNSLQKEIQSRPESKLCSLPPTTTTSATTTTTNLQAHPQQEEEKNQLKRDHHDGKEDGTNNLDTDQPKQDPPKRIKVENGNKESRTYPLLVRQPTKVASTFENEENEVVDLIERENQLSASDTLKSKLGY
ncbi:hypothetical protein DFA_02490 [Cavenderia fasciculata]|uniref:FHA domain-containing protein n=1 Tax=Cavenderia fasciculata TaxID=261658 RepID=F4Q071_CACFS|nr:uncharacterized protein DFA_02490 [Cavenderia fasciculata]EGG18751.1 hypothetical protein DFA_02490 [Cavenderia fasciculata]|eukprot:XP_004357213.1 hypothetical protein DFA_02490 [Cavenderia fasciculata]